MHEEILAGVTSIREKALVNMSFSRQCTGDPSIERRNVRHATTESIDFERNGHFCNVSNVGSGRKEQTVQTDIEDYVAAVAPQASRSASKNSSQLSPKPDP